MLKNIAYILGGLLVAPALLGLGGCSSASLVAGDKAEARAPARPQQPQSAPSSAGAGDQTGKDEFPAASAPEQITGSYLLDCAAISSSSYGCAIYDAATHLPVTSQITAPAITVTYADGTSELVSLTSESNDSRFKWSFQIDRRKVSIVTGVSATATINGKASGKLPLKNVAAISGVIKTGFSAPTTPSTTPANTPVGTNLLQNAGFESGDLTNWTIWEVTPGVSIVETKSPHSGTYHAAQLAPNGGQSLLYQTIAVANGNYTVSCWIAGQAGTSLAFQAADWDGSNPMAKKGLNVTGTGMSLYSVDVTVTSGSITASVWFDGTTATDWSHIDDCSIVRL